MFYYHIILDVEDDLLPEIAQQHSENQNSEQSPTAIYEDLNCLHLTEETVLSQEKDVKSPISKSLFNNVASTIYFSLKDEKGICLFNYIKVMVFIHGVSTILID